MKIQELKKLLDEISQGQWIASNMSGDWGLGGAWQVSVSPHDWDNVVSEIPYVTPYCVGASPGDIRKAKIAAANTQLIVNAPVIAKRLIEADEIIDKLVECLREIASYDTGSTAGLAYTAKQTLDYYEKSGYENV